MSSRTGLFSQAVVHGIEHLVQEPTQKSEKLSQFKDILIQDSTIIRLHEKLAKKWPAVRARKVAAGVKVSMLVSAVSDGPKRICMVRGQVKLKRSVSAHG